MPTRIIREGILDSKAVNALSEQAEIFYRRLMSVVDDYGRFEADTELLRARCFPRQLERWPEARVEDCLTEISRHSPLVSVYFTATGALQPFTPFVAEAHRLALYEGLYNI